MNSEWRDSPLGSPGPLARELSHEIERTVLELVVDGFRKWELGGFNRVGDHEDHYTIRLYECMKKVRGERNLPFVPRYQHVEPSDAMLQGLKDPAHAGRIDITVAWDLLADDTYLSIECKRVAPDDDLARLYVVEGMKRFVRGYYGARAEAGAMVGYIIRGTPRVVLKRVNAQIGRASGMGSGHTLSPADPVGWLSDVFASNHRRCPPLRTIRLTHLFFDLNGIPPSTVGA